MFIHYKKGDLVKIDAYLAGYANERDFLKSKNVKLRGIIISHDEWSLGVSVLVNGQVDIVRTHHLEKVIK